MALSIVIFGASGDLTSRKLVPALFKLFLDDRLPDPTYLVGCARTLMDDDAWREQLLQSTREFSKHPIDGVQWTEFAQRVHYQPLDIAKPECFKELAKRLNSIELGQESTRLYYLATAPSLYEPAVLALGEAGLSRVSADQARVVIEKPFGTNLESARKLNKTLHDVFEENQIYRIDHYLGKETVQNMLVLRFANSIFEPIWNRNYIDHIQITVAEEVSVDQRGAYYDHSGVLRDMFQNHLLQLMMITAMEAPARYNADLVRDEKAKVLRSIRSLHGDGFQLHTRQGQYDTYTAEPGVPASSKTATFGALRLFIDNWRWQGVPFYLRSGKCMSCRTTQIVVQFRSPPHMLFMDQAQAVNDANRLLLQIQPAEGIQIHFHTKVPDAGMRVRMTDLAFRFDQHFRGELPDAYQRLLLDAAQGDASLFARSDEVELAWEVMDPVIAAWQDGAGPPLEIYRRGEWGPPGCDTWMRSQGREWFNVCPVLG